MGAFQAGWTGTKRTVDQWGAGAQQVGQLLEGIRNPSPENLQAKQDLANQQAEKSAIYAGVKQQHPIASMIGEAAPYAALPMRMGAPGMGLAVGGGEALKYGSPEDRAMRGASGFVGGAIAPMLGNIGGAIVNPVGQKSLTQYQIDALRNVIPMGVKPRLSEVTGSPLARAIEDWAANTPGGMGVMKAHAGINSEALDTAAAATIGQKANNLGPQVMDAATKDIGSVFNEIGKLDKVQVKGASVPPIQISSDVGKTADDILSRQLKLPETMRDADLMKLAKDAKYISDNRGRITGQQYQDIRSRLTSMSYDSTDPLVKRGNGALLSALDDSAQTSLDKIGRGDLADQLNIARSQYGNLQVLEKSKVIKAGDIKPETLGNALRRGNPDQWHTTPGGSNDLIDIARYEEAHPPLKPGSPTYARGAIEKLLYAAPANIAANVVTNPLLNSYVMKVGNTLPAKIAEQLINPSIRTTAIGAANSLRDRLLNY